MPLSILEIFSLKSQSAECMYGWGSAVRTSQQLSYDGAYSRIFWRIGPHNLENSVRASARQPRQWQQSVRAAYLPFQSSSNLDIRSILKALPAHCRHILLLSMYLCIHCKSFYFLAYYYLNFIEPETRINKRPMLLSYVIIQNVNIFWAILMLPSSWKNNSW